MHQNQITFIYSNMATPNSAVVRLMSDLKTLEEEPIVGANAQPHGDNIMLWYGIVVGPEGTPYAGVPIRFVLEFNNNYPSEAPKAFFDTEVRYVGGASYKVDGRLAVCLNIFGNFGHVHTEWKNQSEGWSPSYTVSTILITMQGMMMADMLSNSKSDIEMTVRSARDFKCQVTGHDGSDPKKWFPSVLMSQEAVDNYLMSKGIVKKVHQHDPLRDHYICYAKKTTAADGAMMGYGIHVENPKSGLLSSPCEYLCEQAFNEGTRRGSTNKAFEYWLPIVISSKNWDAVKKVFLQRVKEIASAINFQGKEFHLVLKVCSSIMNNLVVEIMNNKNNLTANDKFIDGYFSFYRLLKQYANDKPELLEYVDAQLRNFVTKPEARTKEFVPNLGEFLIYLTISKGFTWDMVGAAFIEENDARNVFWYAVGNYNNPAKYPELLNSNAPDRVRKVFEATPISRNLVMYQVRFSQVAQGITLDMFDSNCGLAPNDLRTALKGVYNEIIKVSDWDGYFKWLNSSVPSTAEREKQLLAAITASAKAGYHKTGGSSSNSNRGRRY